MAATTGLCLVVHACARVDGGAVELSWKLRPASGALDDKFVDCASGKPGAGPITAIRLDWNVADREDFDVWPCRDNHGATSFELPEGTALLRVSPLCEGDQPADPRSYIAPAVEQRQVIAGDTVNLGAVELVVVVSDCHEPMQSCICGLRAVTGHGNEVARRLPHGPP